MPVPSHSPYCQTWLYETSCWSCGQKIYVLQCTCGSAVLFNDVNPFEHHSCLGGIGDSGISGWQAIDVLRAEGMPITPEIFKMVFGNTPAQNTDRPPKLDTVSISPVQGKNLEIIVNLKDFNDSTKNTRRINGLNEMARQFEGIPKTLNNFHQLLFISNNDTEKTSYVVLAAKKDVPNNVKALAKQHAVFFVKLLGTKNDWLLVGMEAL